jgi:hypothetical protein
MACSQKLRIYETLHSLNQAFEQVLADFRRLQEFPFFRRQLLRALSVVVEETRAWANFEPIESMHQRAGRLGQVRPAAQSLGETISRSG